MEKTINDKYEEAKQKVGKEKEHHYKPKSIRKPSINKYPKASTYDTRHNNKYNTNYNNNYNTSNNHKTNKKNTISLNNNNNNNNNNNTFHVKSKVINDVNSTSDDSTHFAKLIASPSSPITTPEMSLVDNSITITEHNNNNSTNNDVYLNLYLILYVV